jgi:hypothetical protein
MRRGDENQSTFWVDIPSRSIRRTRFCSDKNTRLVTTNNSQTVKEARTDKAMFMFIRDMLCKTNDQR